MDKCVLSKFITGDLDENAKTQMNASVTILERLGTCREVHNHTTINPIHHHECKAWICVHHQKRFSRIGYRHSSILVKYSSRYAFKYSSQVQLNKPHTTMDRLLLAGAISYRQVRFMFLSLLCHKRILPSSHQIWEHNNKFGNFMCRATVLQSLPENLSSVLYFRQLLKAISCRTYCAYRIPIIDKAPALNSTVTYKNFACLSCKVISVNRQESMFLRPRWCFRLEVLPKLFYSRYVLVIGVCDPIWAKDQCRHWKKYWIWSNVYLAFLFIIQTTKIFHCWFKT